MENQSEQKPEQQIGQGKNTGMAVVAYILFFIPLLTDAKSDSFVKYHVKQGLVLLIAAVVVSIIGYVPVLGWILVFPLSILLLVLFIIGIMNALNAQEKPLPIIGKWGEQFKI